MGSNLPCCEFFLPGWRKPVGICEPNCFSPATRHGKKQIGSLDRFAFCWPGKKQIGSLNHLAFSRANWKSYTFPIAFSRPLENSLSWETAQVWRKVRIADAKDDRAKPHSSCWKHALDTPAADALIVCPQVQVCEVRWWVLRL